MFIHSSKMITLFCLKYLLASLNEMLSVSMLFDLVASSLIVIYQHLPTGNDFLQLEAKL